MKLNYLFKLLIVLVFCSTSCNINDSLSHQESTIVNIDDMAKSFKTLRTDSTTVSLNDYLGEPFILLLISCSCPDCKYLLDDLHKKIANNSKPIRILAIGRNASCEDLINYKKTNGYTIDMAQDPEGEIYKTYASAYVPRAYVIDSSGKVVLQTIEYQSTFADSLLKKYNEL
jgi:peroxiredoxin